MTAQELSDIDAYLASAQDAIGHGTGSGSLDGVLRLLTALRSEVSVLKATASESAAASVSSSSSSAGSDVLLIVCEAVDRAMDTISTSPSYLTTSATKLYASLTALRAQIAFLRNAGSEQQGSNTLSPPDSQAAPTSATTSGTLDRRHLLAGIPNLAHKGWREIQKAEHIAGIHHDEQALLRSASEFIADGLWRAERIIVLATEPHRRELERRLRETGVDVVSAVVRRKYIARDADETLERIMNGAGPDRAAFEDVMGTLVANGSSTRLETRVFSELVSRLWQRGDRTGALQLEQSWTEFSQTRGVSVFCGYTTDCFKAAEERDALAELCRLHARVVPPGVQAPPRPVPSQQPA